MLRDREIDAMDLRGEEGRACGLFVSVFWFARRVVDLAVLARGQKQNAYSTADGETCSCLGLRERRFETTAIDYLFF